MKRWLLIAMTLMLMLGLCACGEEVAEESATAAYEGTWVSTQETGYDTHLYTFRLLPSGTALFAVYGDDPLSIDESFWARASEWEKDGDRIYIYYEDRGVNDNHGNGKCAYILQIVDENTMTLGGHTYKKSK